MKTTVTAIVGLIAMLVAKFGIQVDVETQLAIVSVILFVVSLLAADGGNTPKAA